MVFGETFFVYIDESETVKVITLLNDMDYFHKAFTCVKFCMHEL